MRKYWPNKLYNKVCVYLLSTTATNNENLDDCYTLVMQIAS